MEYDFGLVASWGERSHQQLSSWGIELEDKGYDVAILSPTSSKRLSKIDIPKYIFSNYRDSTNGFDSVREIESRYKIPSLSNLTFTERLFFRLPYPKALSRAIQLVSIIEEIFNRHSFKYILQARGPEIHRQLSHYIARYEKGIPVWIEFSPFDETHALTTSLDGSWDEYRAIPYNEIPEADRERTREHIEQFREERRFYSHDDEDTDETEGPKSQKAINIIRDLLERSRPGRIRDQIPPEMRLRINKHLNNSLLPTIEESRQLCQETDYVFFPLQYPIESRLTVFSPQFYDQTYLIEYLGRVLPASMQLFVKGHPNHLGRPAPEEIWKLRETDRIQFLNHDLNAHDVIERSEAIVVVNNTVGFETIYHGKPLLTLGDPPYAETPAVTNVDALDDLPDILSEKVSTTVSKERTVESIYSLQKASFPGDRSSYESENVQRLIDSVLTFVDE